MIYHLTNAVAWLSNYVEEAEKKKAGHSQPTKKK